MSTDHRAPYGPGVCSGLVCTKPKTCGRPTDYLGNHLRAGKKGRRNLARARQATRSER